MLYAFPIGAIAAILAPFCLAYGLWRVDARDLILPFTAALYLAVVTPIIIIAIRHQVRLARVRLIELFDANFNMSAGNCSFEFVKGKYFVDVADTSEKELRELKIAHLPRYPFALGTDWMLLLCATPLIVFAGFGLFILFAPAPSLVAFLRDPGVGPPGWSLALKPSLLLLGGELNATPQDHVNALTIAAVAFAGAYFYCLRLFLRAIAVFDLSAVTFLRAFAHMVMATTLAIVIWRVSPNAEDLWAAVPAQWQAESDARLSPRAPASRPTAPPEVTAGGAPAQLEALATPSDKRISKLWLLAAFILGFVPDAALQWTLHKMRLTLKQRHAASERHAPVVPLTVLDGVDFFIAFRLEEANIFDVQNLAASNPIMLHVETPYGIYQTIDWVAQAQLCAVVGPERFLLLKRYNIRTIFDLERAVLGVNAPDELKLVIGAILIGSDKAMTAVRTEFEIEPLDIQGTAFDATLARAMTIETIEHLVRVMIDDLHVHRLRQIWLHIARRLGIKTAQLEDTKPLRNRLEKCQQCSAQKVTSVAAAQPPTQQPPNGASAAP